MCSVNDRIEKLKRETQDLRKEVKDLKETVLQQNELIISLLSKQTGILEETMAIERPMQYKQVSEYSRRFPLQTFKNLHEFEKEINDRNENQIVTIVQALLSPKGIVKSIANVLSENLIMEVNVDGNHNKKRFLSFPKTIDILYQACRQDNIEFTMPMFLNDLRRSFKMVKNRIHKNNCQARQKLREKQEQEEMEQTVQQFIIKTEEADFD